MTKLLRVDENTFVTCDADEPVAWITMGGKRVPIMEGGKLGDNPVGAKTYKPKSAYGKAIQEAKGYEKQAKKEREKAKKAYDKASKNEEKSFNALKNQNEKEYKESDDRVRELNGKAYMHSSNANTQEQLAKTTRSYAKTVRAQKLGEGTKGKVLKESESQKLLKESAQEAK